MTPLDKEQRLLESCTEQAENLRMLLRAASELVANARRLGAFHAAPSDAERDVQDRFVFRFSKSVDAMRKRLFPYLLDYSEDLSELPTLRDRLNRLEKYGLLEAEQWVELGLRRNAFEHDYPDAETREAALRQAVSQLPELVQTYERCRKWLEHRFGLQCSPLVLDLTALQDQWRLLGLA